jgi:hypothetical protein
LPPPGADLYGGITHNFFAIILQIIYYVHITFSIG